MFPEQTEEERWCRGNSIPGRGRRALALAAWMIPACGMLGDSSALAQAIDCNAGFYPGRVLVRFKATTTPGVRQGARAAAGALRVAREFHAVSRLQMVEVAPGKELAAIAAFRNRPLNSHNVNSCRASVVHRVAYDT